MVVVVVVVVVVVGASNRECLHRRRRLVLEKCRGRTILARENLLKDEKQRELTKTWDRVCLEDRNERCLWMGLSKGDWNNDPLSLEKGYEE